MADRLKQKAKNWLELGGKRLLRFKYPLLLLLLGLVLVLAPFGKSRQSSQQTETAATEPVVSVSTAFSEEQYRTHMESELAGILSQIEGAGSVQVMLTLRSGSAVQYQTDTDSNVQKTEAGESSTHRESTVIFSRGSAYDEAAVVKTEYPVFQGALIVSRGADNAAVCLALKNAVAALLGIGTDKITVVKMK